VIGHPGWGETVFMRQVFPAGAAGSLRRILLPPGRRRHGRRPGIRPGAACRAAAHPRQERHGRPSPTRTRTASSRRRPSRVACCRRCSGTGCGSSMRASTRTGSGRRRPNASCSRTGPLSSRARRSSPS
jgi:hypothetical protein